MIPASRPRVVFDCVVFLQGAAFPHNPSGVCLRLAREGAIELFLSDSVIAEVQEVLSRPALQRKFSLLTAEYVRDLLTALVRSSTLLSSVDQLFDYVRDPKDERY